MPEKLAVGLVTAIRRQHHSVKSDWSNETGSAHRHYKGEIDESKEESIQRQCNEDDRGDSPCNTVTLSHRGEDPGRVAEKRIIKIKCEPRYPDSRVRVSGIPGAVQAVPALWDCETVRIVVLK